MFRLHRIAQPTVFAMSVDLLLACSLANATCTIINIMTTPIFIIVSWSHAFFLVVAVRSFLCALVAVAANCCFQPTPLLHRGHWLLSVSCFVKGTTTTKGGADTLCQTASSHQHEHRHCLHICHLVGDSNADDALHLQELTAPAFLAHFEQFTGASLSTARTEARDRFEADLRRFGANFLHVCCGLWAGGWG